MNHVKLAPEKADTIYRSIEQASYQLSDINRGERLRPMQYTARLCWEALYDAREILRLAQQPEIERSHPFSSRSAVTLSGEELARLAQLIEQVMQKLQQVELEKDMEMMKKLAQECQQKLECCLSGALSQRSTVLVTDL